MTKLVSRCSTGLWAIQHQDGQFLADPGCWTTNPQLALRFSSEDDAQYISDGLARLHTVMMGKSCWHEVKGETESLLKPVLLYLDIKCYITAPWYGHYQLLIEDVCVTYSLET